MVLPAEQGHASIVLDMDTYHAKMSLLTETRPYQLLNKDPKDCLTQKVSKRLLTLKWSRQVNTSNQSWSLPYRRSLWEMKNNLRNHKICVLAMRSNVCKNLVQSYMFSIRTLGVCNIHLDYSIQSLSTQITFLIYFYSVKQEEYTKFPNILYIQWQ